MKIIAPAVLALSLISAPSAMAGGCNGAVHKHSPEEMANFYFDKMDLNGDNIVTKGEFEKSSMKNLVKSFDALAPDDSGTVNRDSFIRSFIQAHSEPKPKA